MSLRKKARKNRTVYLAIVGKYVDKIVGFCTKEGIPIGDYTVYVRVTKKEFYNRRQFSVEQEREILARPKLNLVKTVAYRLVKEKK